MKYLKIIGIVSLLAITTSVVACSKNKKNSSSADPNAPIANDSGLPITIEYLDEPGFQIHYQRTEGSYKPWGLWLWSDNAAGAEYQFNYSDDYGVLAYYPISQFGEVSSVGMIVKQLFSYAGDNEWVKDYPNDRFIDFDMLEKDSHDIYHVYIRNSSGHIFTDAARTHQMNAVKQCQFDNATKITVTGNNKLSSVVITKNGENASLATSSMSDNDKTFSATLSERAGIDDYYNAVITFEDGGSCTKPISIRNLYDSQFESEYNYDGELGAIYSHESTTFKVWSPVSKSIKLRIYDNGTPVSVNSEIGSDLYTEYEMTKGEKGVFSYTLSGDLGGKYYTYFVKNASNKDGKEIVDPYAKGAGVNGLRGMIVDFDETNPTGWGSVDYLHYDRLALAVYETHIAELTCSDTWGGTPANAKKYAGFYETGTTYTSGETTVKTGFDHIKELGVNAVQIIPFFDQANDELHPTFNWGYNPLNYNVVEGVYSSNPYDGYVRIRELKELIKAYNQEGITILMDVVYNHVNGLSGSNFDVLMPFYYFRYTSEGQVSNGSGCGNETASDKYMFRKFMIDSIAFWSEEYKLGGFRFDLMGLHDIETMNQVVAKAKEINPYTVIHGEPWTGGTSAMPANCKPAVQKNAKDFVGFGQFNDLMRDSMIKSGMNTVGNKGWVTQTEYAVDPTDIEKGLKGWTGDATNDPNKSVTYATCHDNYTLNDRALVAGINDASLRKKMNILSNSLVFSSQGTTFMLAGEEMLRTKVVYNADGTPKEAKDENGNPLGRYEVSGNSYASSYKTNELNYQWKVDNLDMFETYRSLISMKINCTGLHGTEPNAVSLENNKCVFKVEFAHESLQFVAYHANGATNGQYTVNTSGYHLYLDTLGESFNSSSMTLKPFETLILYK